MSKPAIRDVESEIVIEFAFKIESAQQANEAHRRVLNSFQAAIAVGEFLSQKKSELGHGNWLPWVQENLDFGDRTASNYMRLFKNANHLNRKGLSDLTEGYRMLANRAKTENDREAKRQQYEERVRRVQAANAESQRLLAQQQPVEPKVQKEPVVRPEPDYSEILSWVERSVFEVVDTYVYAGNHTTEECCKLWGLVADRLTDLSERFRRMPLSGDCAE
jgi:Protein of unknown function (DUF3102)